MKTLEREAEPQARQEAATGLEYPAGTRPPKVLWAYAFFIPLLHLLCIPAFFPWFFSWTGVILAILGHFFFGMLGMTIGYHRLLAHQGFTCPKWFEHTLAVLGMLCLQDSPARWVAIHRKHHKESDERPDPHSPLVNFLWGHIGWLILENRHHSHLGFYDQYSRDLLRDPFYRWIEKTRIWIWGFAVVGILYFVAGLAIAWSMTGDYFKGVQFGLSLLVWGVFVRTVVVWHITWSVNSLTHIWGYRTYETTDNSRNNWLVGLLAHGEGWHNNHHAQQRAARHGHKWYEFDMSYMLICCFEAIGLVDNVVRPRVTEPPRKPR